MTGQPRRVSVVVPTCDRPQFLGQALASIRAFESPDLSLEIIVGDNGKTLEAQSIAQSFGAIYVKVAEGGASAGRNAGLRAATGDYIAFLDDDDVWLNTHLHAHLRMLDARPDLDAVVGQVIYTAPDLQPLSDPEPSKDPGAGDQFLKAMLGGYYSQIGTLVARRRVRDTIGLFDEGLPTSQDWDWMLRLAHEHKLGFVQTPSILFRGRPTFGWDKIQIPRARRGTRLFIRHAIRARHLWSSPLDVMRTHGKSQMHYYEYFVDAAAERARRGERFAALRAIINALRIFPFRGAFHLIAPRQLRATLLAAILGDAFSRGIPVI